ncbi:hypothetical protein OT109_18140 [Phycisphaeraceae bacterium D3-23]
MTRRINQWFFRSVARHHAIFTALVVLFVCVTLGNIISAHLHWFEWGILRAVGVLSGYYNDRTLQPLEAGLALTFLLTVLFAPMVCCLGISRRANRIDDDHNRWRIIAAAILWAALALSAMLIIADVTGVWYDVAYYHDNTSPLFINLTGLGPPRFWPIGMAWVACLGLLLFLPAVRKSSSPYPLIIGMTCLMLLLCYTARRVQDWLSWKWHLPIPWHKLQYSGLLPAFLILCLALLSAFACLLIELRRGTLATTWPGRCESCGYDLRGNPDKPCPECGADPSEADKHLNPHT